MGLVDKLESVYINYCDNVSRAAEVPLYETFREYSHKALDKTHQVLDTAIGVGIVGYLILDDLFNYHKK